MMTGDRGERCRFHGRGDRGHHCGTNTVCLHLNLPVVTIGTQPIRNSNQLRRLEAKRTVADSGNQHLPIRRSWRLWASRPSEEQVKGKDLLPTIHVLGNHLPSGSISLVVQHDGHWDIVRGARSPAAKLPKH